jgi:hypothetical protein
MQPKYESQLSCRSVPSHLVVLLREDAEINNQDLWWWNTQHWPRCVHLWYICMYFCIHAHMWIARITAAWKCCCVNITQNRFHLFEIRITFVHNKMVYCDSDVLEQWCTRTVMCSNSDVLTVMYSNSDVLEQWCTNSDVLYFNSDVLEQVIPIFTGKYCHARNTDNFVHVFINTAIAIRWKHNRSGSKMNIVVNLSNKKKNITVTLKSIYAQNLCEWLEMDTQLLLVNTCGSPVSQKVVNRQGLVVRRIVVCVFVRIFRSYPSVDLVHKVVAVIRAEEPCQAALLISHLCYVSVCGYCECILVPWAARCDLLGEVASSRPPDARPGAGSLSLSLSLLLVWEVRVCILLPELLAACMYMFSRRYVENPTV